MNYRISVEVLENGFAVEVPDMDAMAEKQAAAKKAKQSDPYMGDCMEKYAAKTVKEVLGFVKAALEKIPESEYDAGFKEASAKK